VAAYGGHVREAVKRLHIDGTAYWVPMDTIKPFSGPGGKS